MSTESEQVATLGFINARLKALIGIGLELAAERDAELLLQRACDAARDLFGASYVTLGIVDTGDRTTRRVLASGTEPSTWSKPGDALTGILGTVVSERRTLRGENPGGRPGRLQLHPLHPPVHAFLLAPLASPAQVYGWFLVVGGEGSSFTEDDEYVMTALSSQVGRMYEARHYRDVARERAEALEHEVLERHRTADALRTAEERMRFALEAAGVGIWDMDYTTGTLRWSEILEAQYGLRPGTFGGTFEAFADRLHPEDRTDVIGTIETAMKSGSDFSVLNRVLWADGTVRWLSGAGRIHLDERGQPVRGIGISMDVTERRMLEEQYRQAQKMEAVGRLAAGVAHDFNNMLGVILGYAQLAKLRLGSEHAAAMDLDEIGRAGEKATGLTRQLLEFSRQQVLQLRALDLNAVVLNMEKLLKRLIGASIELQTRPGDALGPILADQGQIEQILLNLVVNARDAMPSGGRLTIATSEIVLNEIAIAGAPELPPGRYVVLAVSDNGVGMDAEVRAHIFKPFFTTKAPGEGTGLGLSTAFGIVQQCGGGVEVCSQPGQGATFKFYFPRMEAASGSGAATRLDAGTEAAG